MSRPQLAAGAQAGLAPGLRPGKVLYLINGEHYAGAERVQDLLALNLPGLGWQVDFVCLKSGLFERLREAKDGSLAHLPMRSRLDLAPVAEIARRLREGGYDLLHTHTPRTALIGRLAAGRAGVPMVHHVHSRTDADTESAWRNRLNSAIQRFGLGRSRRLIAVSHSIGDYLRRLGYAQDRISVVANGVPACAAARDWQPPASSWVLGCMALFRPRKGVEVLIEALARLRAIGVPLSLRAIGGFESEDYRRHVLALAEARGVAEHIVWTGFTRDIEQELAKVDLFVVPSLFGEGLPMVMIEAMASGLPVVASISEGTPEALDHGAAGLLVPPGDAGALADALSGLIAAPSRTRALAHAGLRRQREHYSDASMARQVAAIYQELRPGSRPP